MKNQGFSGSWLSLATVAALIFVGRAPARAQVADRAAYLADLSAQLRVAWPANRTINLVCHGHSVPAGYAQTPTVNTFNAYPLLLHQALSERYPTAVINVIVTAIGGEASESGAQRFAKDVLTHRPDLITIDYGLNDRFLGLARAKQAWSSMIEAAQAKGIKVILLTPTADLTANLDNPADPLNQQAEQIRGLARQYQVGLVDSLALFQAYVAKGGQLKDLMAQVNHPSRKGHELVVAGLLGWFPK